PPRSGMCAARLRGPGPDGLPQYVGVQRAPFMTNPAYLGVAHRAFDTGDPSQRGFSPPNLALVTGVDNRRLDDRRALIIFGPTRFSCSPAAVSPARST